MNPRLAIRLRSASAFVLLATFVVGAAAQTRELPRAEPEAVGMSSERLGRIVARLRDDVAAQRIPGAVILVARQGKVVLHEAVGRIDPAAPAPMTKDSIFRIYSMSKPITSVTAMMLVEEGRLKLDDPVAKYIPAFAKVQVGVEKAGADGKPTLELVAPRRAITIQDLMRHTSGLTYGFFGSSLVKTRYVEANLLAGDPDNETFAERLAALPLAYQPGSTWDYSQSTDVVGRVVEVVTGQSLYRAEKERLLDPLGMTDTAFHVADAAHYPRIAEPFANDRTIGVNAVFSDPRVATRNESGGGGMVSTSMDYARFLQMLLNGGTLDGRRYLGPRTIAFMTADHLGTAVATTPLYLPGPGYGFGLGFAVRRTTGEAPFPAEAGTYYWGGAGGTYFWVDPKTELFTVLMLQSPRERVHYRTLLQDMVYAAVMK
jgi:CubicO group peptidase (beta-lactamase class C family)